MTVPSDSRTARWRCLSTARLALVSSLLLLSSCRGFGLVAVVDRTEPVPVQPIQDAGLHPDAALGAPPIDAAVSDAGRTTLDECGASNPAGLTAEQVRTLLFAPNPEPSQRYLYPYEGTVFPGAVSAPLVMWAGPSSDAVLLRLRTKTFEYSGCLKPSAPGRVAIPQHAWDLVAAVSVGPDDPIELRLTTLAGDRASGPISRTFTIARAGFAGSIYYMSYGNLGTAKIWRLRPRQPVQPLFSAVDCSGCHAIAANGTRLVGFSRGTGTAYRIAADTIIDPQQISTQLPGAEYAGVYPDGSMYVATAHPQGRGTRSFSIQQSNAGLFDVASGNALPGANIPVGATVPAFSPSGALLAFNDFAIDAAHGLAVMNFDAKAAIASNYVELFRDPAKYPAWPSFTPDEKRIVFACGVTTDFSAMGARLSGRTGSGPPSDLYSVDVASRQTVLLSRAMGFVRPGDSDADTYLPFGAADLHQNYYPNVYPATSGGYAWVVFDSIRNYGNQGVMRQVWGAAIDLSGNAEDPSHPAFYVPGQDSTAVNLRAVAAIDACPLDDRACVTQQP
jgi:hypothetical protein